MPRPLPLPSRRRASLTIIGLVGGIGCGKTTVAKQLESLGALRIDADALAHEALNAPQVRRAVVGRFGREVLGPGGRIDRVALGKVAFADAAALRFLEQRIHPVVLAAIRRELATERRTRAHAAVILDVPLLIESGLDALCTAVVFIETRRRDRTGRTVRDRGWTRDAVARRERFQISPAEKRRRAGFRVDNRGARAELAENVRRLFGRILLSATSALRK